MALWVENNAQSDGHKAAQPKTQNHRKKRNKTDNHDQLNFLASDNEKHIKVIHFDKFQTELSVYFSISFAIYTVSVLQIFLLTFAVLIAWISEPTALFLAVCLTGMLAIFLYKKSYASKLAYIAAFISASLYLNLHLNECVPAFALTLLYAWVFSKIYKFDSTLVLECIRIWTSAYISNFFAALLSVLSFPMPLSLCISAFISSWCSWQVLMRIEKDTMLVHFLTKTIETIISSTIWDVVANSALELYHTVANELKTLYDSSYNTNLTESPESCINANTARMENTKTMNEMNSRTSTENDAKICDSTGQMFNGSSIIPLMDLNLNVISHQNVRATQCNPENGNELGTNMNSKINHINGQKLIAMDCEMVGSGRMNILARVSIVDESLNILLDEFVKPTRKITNYRTRVSGIRKSDLENAKEFRIVQQIVQEILKDKILVGHAIKHDLKVLHLWHPIEQMRDTSTYRPLAEKISCRKTPSLKLLSSKILGEQIQTGEHNSVEDACAAMKLYHTVANEWEKMYGCCYNTNSSDSPNSRGRYGFNINGNVYGNDINTLRTNGGTEFYAAPQHYHRTQYNLQYSPLPFRGPNVSAFDVNANGNDMTTFGNYSGPGSYVGHYNYSTQYNIQYSPLPLTNLNVSYDANVCSNGINTGITYGELGLYIKQQNCHDPHYNP